MNLDKLQIKASIRNGSQAIDLGYLLARSWWFHLLLASFLPALIAFIPLLFIFKQSPFWAIFIIWWLKPMWERLPLFYASRKIFNETISLKDVRINFKSIFFKNLLADLLWRRVSLQRAFNAPVSFLENLTSKNRSNRLAVLHGKYSDSAINNQFLIFMFEVALSMALFFFMKLFIFDSLDIELTDSHENLTLLAYWVYALSAFVAMSMAMPFHSMAGFSLYINRRIELEAWDIEISFKEIAKKRANTLKSTALSGLFVVFIVSIMPSESWAQIAHNQESSKELIQKVLASDDFGIETTLEKWRFKSVEEEEKAELFPQWIIELLKIIEQYFSSNEEGKDSVNNDAWNWIDMIKVSLIVIFIGFFIYFFYRFRTPMSQWRKKKTSTHAVPDVLFGLDVTPDSLPDDVTKEVMRLWQAQLKRDAMALLYRATLSRLIDNSQLMFKASDTELECAEMVKANADQCLSDYFLNLTNTWRHLAYGHVYPQFDELQQLCIQWDLEINNEA